MEGIPLPQKCIRMTEENQNYSPAAARRKRNFLIFFLVLLLVAGLWGLWWLLIGSRRISSNDAYVQGNIIPVQAQTAGTIRQVLAENTEYVHAGQLLATVQGDRSYLALRQAEATLGKTVRRLRQSFSEVDKVQQTLQAQGAQLQKLQGDLARYQKAAKGDAVASIQISNTQADIRALQAQMGATKAQLAAAAAVVGGTTLQSNPKVQAAVAHLEQAYIAWARRNLRAPVSGFVAQRAAYPGLMVHSGECLFTVVPLNQLWVVANIKETEMARVRPGQPVRLTSYYYGSGVVYHGVVQGLLPGAGSAFAILPPENATGNYIHIVERVPIRIALPVKELAEHPLRPGLSMLVQIDIARHGKGVLQPVTQTPIQGYQTMLYGREMSEAQTLASKIIAQNA